MVGNGSGSNIACGGNGIGSRIGNGGGNGNGNINGTNWYSLYW